MTSPCLDFAHLGEDLKGFAFVLNFINHIVTDETIAAINHTHDLQQLFCWTLSPGINEHVKDWSILFASILCFHSLSLSLQTAPCLLRFCAEGFQLSVWQLESEWLITVTEARPRAPQTMNKNIEPKVSTGYICAPSSNRKGGGVGVREKNSSFRH